MGRISTSIGLITGTPINDTVDQLIQLSAQPRDRLQNRIDLLKRQQKAITELTVLTVGLQLAGKSFGSASAFQKTTVNSSHADVLSATATGSPKPGTYSIRTLQTAATQSFATQSFASADKTFGAAGTLTIRGGGFVDRSVRLDDLNGGRGVAGGSIRITDRSGASQSIDLSGATTIDEVLHAINDSAEIRIRATTDGDAIHLEDLTGERVANLQVEEVAGGSTAADLGLRGIKVGGKTATGTDIYRLTTETRLDALRDGRGIGFGDGNDLQFTFRDGTALNLDFSDFSRAASQATGTTDSADPNAALTVSAVTAGAEADGIRVRFVDDPAVVAGNESVQLLDGPSGRELVFGIEAGVTTAAQAAAALAADPELSDQFTVTASGDGTGLVTTADAAVLGGGAAIAATDVPDVGDLLRVLNDADPERLSAALSSDGDAIVITDLTAGGGSLEIRDLGSSRVAADLGLAGTSTTGTLTGTPLQTGLQSVSLAALGGGAGLGPLGSLNITARDGSTAAVDLSAADTLQDVINGINKSGLAIEASIDPSGAGLQVRDLSGGSTAAFSISSADATASKLGLAASTNDVLIRGDGLNLQFVDRATRLESLNQGRGVGEGSFRLTDSSGATGVINLKVDGIETVGGLLDAINELGLDISAALNETGDGIRLTDTGSGSVSMSVSDTGSGTSAAALGLAGTASSEVIAGRVVKTIDGRQIDRIEISSSDTLTTLATRLQEQGRFASAAVIGGGANGASLSITSRRGGEAGRLTIDTDGLDLGIRQTARGRDAVIAIGGTDAGGSTTFRSPDGVFADAVEGLSFTAKAVSDAPVTVTVSEDRSNINSSVKQFVDQFNKLAKKLKDLTFYNAEDGSSGLLFGSTEALRIQSSMGRVITGRFGGQGDLRAAADVGIRLNKDGQMELDAEKLKAALEANPEAVQTFFTAETDGFVAKVDRAIESLAGVEDSLLISRAQSLTSQIERSSSRVDSMNVRLGKERDRMLKQYYAMEAAIAKLQSNQQALSQLSYLANRRSSQSS